MLKRKVASKHKGRVRRGLQLRKQRLNVMQADFKAKQEADIIQTYVLDGVSTWALPLSRRERGGYSLLTLLITHYHYSLLITHSTHYSLYSLLTLLITHYSLLTTHYSLLITHSTHYSLYSLLTLLITHTHSTHTHYSLYSLLILITHSTHYSLYSLLKRSAWSDKCIIATASASGS